MKYIATAVLLVVLVGFAKANQDEGQRERFVALYKTATTYTVSTSTVSAYYSCASTSSATACSGRRRRKRKAGVLKQAIDSDTMPVHELSGSLAADDSKTINNPQGRLGFTVWTTSTSTITMTTTSVNSATTVSLIYLCTASSGVSTVPSCG
uniref:Putative secretory protein n=1 Tax=Parasacculina yatsui TaxID=2836420 RepID=A0A386AVR8_9CRUS|nr:putative secretory protein [Parasacculina yatsui]